VEIVAKMRQYQNNFKSGELGKEIHGRFDLDMYAAATKKFINGVSNAQGSLTNKTLKIEELIDLEVPLNVSKFYNFNKEESNMRDDAFVIVYQEKISRNIRTATLNGSDFVVTSNKTNSKIDDFSTQINNVIFCTSFETSNSYNERLYGVIKSQEPDYQEIIQIFRDSESSDGITIVDVTSETADISWHIDGNNLVLDVSNAEEEIADTIFEERSQEFEWDDTIPSTYIFEEDINGVIYTGVLNLTSREVLYRNSYLEFDDAEQPIEEETPEYKRTSMAFIKIFIDPVDFKKKKEIRYKVYRSDKYQRATYSGEVSARFYTTNYDVEIKNTNTQLLKDYTNVIVLGETEATPYSVFIEKIIDLDTYIIKKPASPDNIFGDELNGFLGREDINYMAWRYDISDSHFEIAFYTEEPANNSVDKPDGSLSLTVDEWNKLFELYINGGVGRVEVSEETSTGKYNITKLPSVDTAWIDNTTAELKVVWKTTSLRNLWFKEVLDLKKVRVSSLYAGRLIIANTKEGSNVIAFSQLNNTQDFTIIGVDSIDGYVTRVTTVENMYINRVVGYKSLMLFTEEGIFASHVNKETFIPSRIEFPLVTRIVPSKDVGIAFLNEGMAFVNSSNSRIYLAMVSDANTEYKVYDLNLVNESMVKDITDIVNVEFNNDTGYSYLLIHSEQQDAILQWVDSENVLSWTRLEFGQKGFRDAGIIDRNVFTVNVTQGIVYKVFEGYTDKTEIELLPPKYTDASGVPAVLRDNYIYKNVKLLLYGEYDVIVNGVRKSYVSDNINPRETNIVEFPQLHMKKNQDLNIKIVTDKEVILQGILSDLEI
jgi:hypothetical protein